MNADRNSENLSYGCFILTTVVTAISTIKKLKII